MGGRLGVGETAASPGERTGAGTVRGAVRQLLPDPVAEVDVAEVYGRAGRPVPAGRPWVLANVVASVDGSAVVAGRTASLSSTADRALFHLLRSLADVVLVGATTVRVEGYGPARGPDPPAIAVVSRSLRLDWSAPLFAAAEARTVVVTCAAADPAGLRQAHAAAEVVVAGGERVDLGEAVRQLGRRGAGVVVCEGGPTLLGEMIAADLVDELCTTIAPVAVAGTGPRVAVGGAPSGPRALRLASVLEEEGSLFLRHLRAAPGGAQPPAPGTGRRSPA